MRMRLKLSRRSLFKTGAALGAASLAPFGLSQIIVPKRRVLRIGHITDVHVQPQGVARSRFRDCLRKVQEVNQVDLILNTGDSIMDSYSANESRTRDQWNSWREVVSSTVTAPMWSAIGNHDIWGWDKSGSGTTGNEPLWGKKWALQELGLPAPYYTQDINGWRVIALDSTSIRQGTSYHGRLDDAQFSWFSQVVRTTPQGMPILVMSHIPILSVSAYLDGNNESSGDWRVPAAWMHIDARRIKDLFHQSGQVKLCLSGHMHLRDQSDYNRTHYVCSGAVSGNWWGNGGYGETPPGYSVIDLYADGSYGWEYHTY